MAVPVFDSVKDYLKKVNLKSSKVIRHVLMFETAIKSFCFRIKWSKSNFSRVLFDCMRGRVARETQSFGRTYTSEMVPEVLRLRGGAGGDEEKWSCDTCGKILASKRNLDLHMSSVHVSHEDFDCVMSDGVLKWRCSLCCNLLSSKQRIISHLITTHGKDDLEQGKKQNLQSRTTLWRRKRSADGSFIHEQCSSIQNFQDEVSPLNLLSCK